MIQCIWRWLWRPMLALIALTLAWLVVEIVACGLLWFAPPAGPHGRWEFRATRPAPYAGAEYFGPAFLDESMRCVRLISPSNSDYLVAGDFHGQFIHVENRRRHTSDQPDAANRRLLLFGGSTVFNQEVPDEHTLASCLQRELNERAGPRYRVENYGAPAMIARQQTERLIHTALASGDLVLFYDGVNDVYYPIYNGNPTGYRIGDDSDGGVRQLSGAQALLYPLTFRLKSYSAVATLLFHRLDGPRPANIVDADSLSRHLDDADTGFCRALAEARTYVESHGAHFVHVLQPQLFSLASLSAYERSVMRNELKALPGLDEAYRQGYPRLRQAIERAGVVRHDLSDALDARADGEEFYFDFCHVNHAANARLARAIAARLSGI